MTTPGTTSGITPTTTPPPATTTIRAMARRGPASLPASRTALVLGAAGLLAAPVVPLSAAADPADASVPCGPAGVFTASPPTCTYATAGTDVFTVPAGVGSLTVDLYGAEGGGAAGYVVPNPPNEGAPGGHGGRTSATLSVTPGQTLQITRGGVGSSGISRKGEYARPGGRRRPRGRPAVRATSSRVRSPWRPTTGASTSRATGSSARCAARATTLRHASAARPSSDPGPASAGGQNVRSRSANSAAQCRSSPAAS